MTRPGALLCALLVACGDDPIAADAPPGDAPPGDGAFGVPDAGPLAERWEHDVLATDLTLDLATRAGTATVTVGAAGATSVSFEIGDLDLAEVRDGDGAALAHRVVEGPPRRVDVGVPASEAPVSISFAYTFQAHPAADFDGWAPDLGVTFLWPTFCGNLFPCKPAPADGTTFTATVTGVEAGAQAVYPAAIPAPAPSYMFAVAVGDYTYDELGVTDAGTHVGLYSLPGDRDDGLAAAELLADIFGWYEETLGPYTFGDHVASVSADWGASGYGGMEHHPFWHVGRLDFGWEEVHAHEAAHGWYGDGVRIRCWEDFVLSEGTTTYLAAKAITAARGADAGAAVWASYRDELDWWVAHGDTVAYPDGCGIVDFLDHPLWSGVPYYKGAFFFRALEEAVGESALLAALASFYVDRVGEAASMGDLLDRIHASTGFDPTALAEAWLRSPGVP